MSETNIETEVQATDDDNLDTFSDDFFGQKSKEATPAASKGGLTKVEAAQDGDPGDGSEADGSQKLTPDPNDDPDAEYKEEPPKKKTVQDRIDELVRQREDEKREAATLRQEIETLKKSLPAPAPVATEKSEPTPDDLDKDGNPVYKLGEFDPQYIRDLTRHTLETERVKAQVEAQRAQQANESQRAMQELQTGWNSKLEAAKTEYVDLEDKVRPLLDSFNGLNSDYAGYLSTVLMSMDKGPDVLYYLSNHPDEALSIVNSGAQKATLALGRIEAKFLDADAQKQLAKPRVSKAPEPPAVRARGTNGAFISIAPDTDDLDAFQAEFFSKKK